MVGMLVPVRGGIGSIFHPPEGNKTGKTFTPHLGKHRKKIVDSKVPAGAGDMGRTMPRRVVFVVVLP